MMPRCPQCDAPGKLSQSPQTNEQFSLGTDNYVCANGHEFVAVIPLKVKDGNLIRADME